MLQISIEIQSERESGKNLPPLEPILSELTNDFGSAFGGISFEATNSEYDPIMVWMDIRISRCPVVFSI